MPQGFSLLLIIKGCYFEVCSWVLAGWANFGSFGSCVNMSAVPASPSCLLFTFEYFFLFKVFQQSQVSFFMLFFNKGYLAKKLRNIFKAFFYGSLLKFLVHGGPFIIFPFCRMLKVLCRVSYSAQKFEYQFCMFFFIICGFLKNSGYLLISFLFCSTCEIQEN